MKHTEKLGFCGNRWKYILRSKTKISSGEENYVGRKVSLEKSCTFYLLFLNRIHITNFIVNLRNEIPSNSKLIMWLFTSELTKPHTTKDRMEWTVNKNKTCKTFMCWKWMILFIAYEAIWKRKGLKCQSNSISTFVDLINTIWCSLIHTH